MAAEPGAGEGEGGDDFEDIVDTQNDADGVDGASQAGDDDFVITGDGGTSADSAFDHVVECLQDIVMGEEFQALLSSFMMEHCHNFEDTDENKHIYATLFKQYSDMIEGFLEAQLKEMIDGFAMNPFLEELAQRGEEEVDAAVFDLLVSMGDFETFKQEMLAAGAKRSDIAVGGEASKIHVDEDEDGEARPDLDDIMVIAPASPSAAKT